MTAAERAPQLPFDRPNVLEVAPLLDVLRREGPIVPVRTPAGDPAWLVTRYDELRELFGDTRLGRSHPAPRNAATISDAAIQDGPSGDYDTEEADHARLRRMLVPSFSAKRMRRLGDHVQKLVAVRGPGVLPPTVGRHGPDGHRRRREAGAGGLRGLHGPARRGEALHPGRGRPLRHGGLAGPGPGLHRRRARAARRRAAVRRPRDHGGPHRPRRAVSAHPPRVPRRADRRPGVRSPPRSRRSCACRRPEGWGCCATRTRTWRSAG